jgi:GR25 family glycosyltransferase involved in LPS biosynthesis
MNAYVITILDNPHSVAAAERCIESGKKFGYDVKIHPAFSPKDNPRQIFQEENLRLEDFDIDARFSRLEPCMCGFLSHRSLWKKALQENKQILILEHDAIFIDKIPLNIPFGGLISFGRPSYGQFNQPKKEGVYKLFSKVGGYLPGAHAYAISPKGAKKLIEHAQVKPAPTDLFINRNDFPFISEYYPWPVMADDKVSTIQHDAGCIAKHNYRKGISIV